MEIGEKIYSEKFRFKFREGFALKDIRIPARICETISPVGYVDENYLRAGINQVEQFLQCP